MKLISLDEHLPQDLYVCLSKVTLRPSDKVFRRNGFPDPCESDSKLFQNDFRVRKKRVHASGRPQRLVNFLLEKL